MDIGRAIKVERARLGINQAELAARMDVHAMTISRWERGTAEPRYSDLQKLSEAFGRPMSEWTEEKEPAVG